jgi:transketolase
MNISPSAMRTAFIEELTAQARVNPRIFLTVGDLGYSVVEPFAEEFPERFLNAGIAEQNMTGVAAGLASEGYHVFTYSIANFPTLRCLEQIRNDICYHGLPVTIVSVGAGTAYGNLGYSHHAVQDVAILRTMPGITVLSPATPSETRLCVRWLVSHPSPSYLRIGKAGEPELYPVAHDIQNPVLVKQGSNDTAIVASGAILKVAIDFAESQPPASAPTVFSMPMLKPIQPSVAATLKRFKHLVALEENVSEGGLFAALAENLPRGSNIHSCYVFEHSAHLVGSQSWLWRQNSFQERLTCLLRECVRQSTRPANSNLI